MFHSYVSLPEGNLLDNHSWGYTSPMFRQTPRTRILVRGQRPEEELMEATGGSNACEASCCPLGICRNGSIVPVYHIYYIYRCIIYIYNYIYIILCVFIKVIRIPLIKIYRCGLYSRHHIYCTLVGYKCIFKVFVVCCNLRVSCLGSSNKFHSYIDVVTHVGDHFGKKSCRTIFRWRC
jgi:hypothetical protein